MKGTLLGRGQDLELVVLDSLNIGFLDSHAKDKVAGNSLCCGLSGVNLQSEIVMSQGQGTYNRAKLLNMLTIQMRETKNLNTFKTMTNNWIWKNIPIFFMNYDCSLPLRTRIISKSQ